MVLNELLEQTSTETIREISMSDSDEALRRSHRGKKGRKYDSDLKSESEDENRAKRKKRKRIIEDDDDESEKAEFELDDHDVKSKSTKSTKTSARLGKSKPVNSFDSGDDDVSTTKTERASRSTKTSPKQHSSQSSPATSAPSRWLQPPSRPSSRPSKTNQDPKLSKKNNDNEGTIKRKSKPTKETSSLIDNLTAPPPPATPPKPQPAPPKAAPSKTRAPLPNHGSYPAKSPPQVVAPKQREQAKHPIDVERERLERERQQHQLRQQQRRQRHIKGMAAMHALNNVCTKFDISVPPKSMKERIDLFGTFLSTEDESDFFDRNKDGHIVIPAQVPVFPEDFRGGQKEHKLAWWGITDDEVRRLPPARSNNGRDQETRNQHSRDREDRRRNDDIRGRRDHQNQNTYRSRS